MANRVLLCLATVALTAVCLGAESEKMKGFDADGYRGMKIFYNKFLAACTKITGSKEKKSSTKTTDLPACKNKEGYSKLTVDFVNYNNPTENRTCKINGSRCDLYFTICANVIGERYCSLVNISTEVIGNTTTLSFSNALGGMDNPLKLEASSAQLTKGIQISVTVLNVESNNAIDTFIYKITSTSGAVRKSVEIASGKRESNSRLLFTWKVFCPLLSPASATVAPVIEPQPCECQRARDLTEIWRRTDRGGQNDSTTQCDTREMKAPETPWFRFSGEAGNRLLDTCAPGYSCGSLVGLWSNGTMPVSVGQIVRVTAYGALYGACDDYEEQLDVMRCSEAPYDYIYKYRPRLGESVCNQAFCGMR